MSTTLGHASFHPFKQNQFDPKVYAKRGRPKKVNTHKLNEMTSSSDSS